MINDYSYEKFLGGNLIKLVKYINSLKNFYQSFLFIFYKIMLMS